MSDILLQPIINVFLDLCKSESKYFSLLFHHRLMEIHKIHSRRIAYYIIDRPIANVATTLPTAKYRTIINRFSAEIEKRRNQNDLNGRQNRRHLYVVSRFAGKYFTRIGVIGVGGAQLSTVK